MQIVLPIVEGIKAGESYEYCTWTDRILDNEVLIKGTRGIQSQSGHHVVVFYTTKYQPPGTQRVCTDDDMATFRFAAGAGGEGINTEDSAPGDLVYPIPKGAQLVVNHHYLNATTHDLRAQSSLSLRYLDAGLPFTRAGSVAYVDTSLRIPPGAYAMDINCTTSRMTKIWDFLPHLHRWGSHTWIDIIQGDKTTRAFDLDWSPAYTFHPPEIKRDPSDPLVLNVGDQVKVHCEWNNDSGSELTFGMEMCVAFGHTINDNNVDNIACDAGRWTDF
jgi:hypothetical protein